MSGLAQPIHRSLGLGSERADHQEYNIRILAAVFLHRRVAAAETFRELCYHLIIDLEPVQGRQVGLVAEIGIGAASKHCHRLALGRPKRPHRCR